MKHTKKHTCKLRSFEKGGRGGEKQHRVSVDCVHSVLNNISSFFLRMFQLDMGIVISSCLNPIVVMAEELLLVPFAEIAGAVFSASLLLCAPFIPGMLEESLTG